MEASRWKKIEDIFQDALDLSGGARQNFIIEKTDGDEELRAEVEKLVARFEKEDEFLESPVWTDSVILGNTLKNRVASSIENEIPPSLKEKSFTGKQVGVYRLTDEIGKGGMGVVFAAERADGEFRQKVAVKLIKRGMDTDFIVRRFRHERQILANLNHPNVARLLDGGTTDDDLPFFVMEFIEGKPLLKYCEEKNLDLRQKLKLFLEVCSPVIYAHRRKIIHRDIKPSNILVTDEGAPKLLDFGIAKLLDTESIHESLLPTATAMRLMTPEYASPEQVRGEEITPASDQYSLGVLLYELITGSRPYKFPSRSPHDIARVICEEIPSEPSSGSFGKFTTGEIDVQFDEEFCKKLDRIVLKTLRKEPSERYASVEEFAEDIERFLQNKTVRAESFTGKESRIGFPSPVADKFDGNIGAEIQRSEKSVLKPEPDNLVSPRRRGVKQGVFLMLLAFLLIPFVAVLTATAIFPPQLSIFILILFFFGGLIRIIYALLFAASRKNLKLSETAGNETSEAETRLITSHAPRETIDGKPPLDYLRADPRFEKTLEKTNHPLAAETKNASQINETERNSSTETQNRLQNNPAKHSFPFALKFVLPAAVALGFGFLIYNFITNLNFDSSDSNISFTTSNVSPEDRWKNNFASMMNVRRLTATGIVRRAAVSPDGKQIAYISGDNQNQSLRIRETDFETERELVAPEANFYLEMKFSPDGKYIYYLLDRASSPRTLYRISTGGGASEKISEEVFKSFALSPDGRQIAYDYANSVTQNYNIRIAEISEDNSLQNPQFITEVAYPNYFMGSFSFSPDGKKLMYAVNKFEQSKELTNLFTYDFETKQETQLTTKNFVDMTGGLWRKGGEEIVICANEDNSSLYQLWLVSFPSGEATRLTNDFYDYSGISLSEDSTSLVTTRKDSTANLWLGEFSESNRGFEGKTKQITNKSSRRDGIEGVNWTKDEHLVFTSSINGENDISVINADGTEEKTIPVETIFPSHPFLAADNRFLVFADQKDQRMSVWRFDTQTNEVAEISSRYALTPSVSPDEKFVYYSTFLEGKNQMTIHRKPLLEGAETDISSEVSITPVVSPDGKFVACLLNGEGTDGNFQIAIFPTEKTDGKPLKIFKVFQPGNFEDPLLRPLAWSPDGKFLYFVNYANNISNIFRLAIEGDQKSVQMTFFTSGKIFNFAVAPDGKTVVSSRGSTSTDIVLFKKSQ